MTYLASGTNARKTVFSSLRIWRLPFLARTATPHKTRNMAIRARRSSPHLRSARSSRMLVAQVSADGGGHARDERADQHRKAGEQRQRDRCLACLFGHFGGYWDVGRHRGGEAG